MDVNQSTSVEQILLDRVEKQLRHAGVQGVGGPYLLEVLRRVIDDTKLAPEEELALAPDPNPEPGRIDALDRFIAVRVERALGAALEFGSRSAGLQTSLHAPRVVVCRTKSPTARQLDLERKTTTAREIRGPTPTLGTKKVEELGQEGFGVLVLADGPVIDGFLDRHADFRIAGHGLGLHFRAGEDDELLTLGAADFKAVHVLEFESAFAHLEFTLELAMRDHLAFAGSGPQPAPIQPSTVGPTGPASKAALLQPTGASDPNDGLVGSIFDGKYLLNRRIGKGGFGVVYEARDLRLDHRVAIKVLHPEATRSPEELEAFKSEARRATRLSHPNIVDWKTFEQGRDGVWYFVMELLEGEELDVVLKREGRLDAKRTGRILLQILDALRTAHNVGDGQSVLHLDLKPKNVFLIRERPGETGDKVKVIDFGIGQFVGADALPPQPPGPGPATGTSKSGARASDAEIPAADLGDWEAEQTLFSVHHFDEELGGAPPSPSSASDQVQRSTACTPEYAAPEQCAHLLPELEAIPLDSRADLYALGVMGFQMLTGKLPYDKPKRRKDLLHIKQSVEPHKVGSQGVRVPRKLAQFIDRCLARDRNARYGDSTEAYEVLRRIVHPPLRKSLLAAAGVLVLGAVATAWMIGQSLVQEGLDVYTRIDGVEKSLAASRLYLGPERPQALLRVSGLDATWKLEAIRLVDSREVTANAIPGFHVVPQDDRQVLLTADAASERIQRPVYLEVTPDGRAPEWSVPFEIVWLGAHAWDLAEASVAELGDRALDPVGATLSIRVRGSPADLSGVRAECGERSSAAGRNETLARGEDEVYEVPLESLDLAPGPVQIRAIATDLAGRSVEREFRAEIATGALTLYEASLDATAVGGRYSLSPRGDPELSVRASRKSDLLWTVRDENGAILMRGSAQGLESGRYPLTGLTRLRGGQSFSGSVEVAVDEAAYVLHADPEHRGTARSRLDFTFVNSAPDYSVRLSTPDGGLGKPLSAEKPVFVARHDLLVRVGRENSLPLRVQVLCAPARDPADVLTLEPRTLVDREAITTAFPLTLAEDGEYAVTVRVWRYDLPGQDTSRDPDSTLDARVVVDSTPARLEVREPAGRIVLRSRSEPTPKLEVRVADDAGAGDLLRTPVDLHWDLVLAQRPDPPIASGVLGSAVPGGAPVFLELPQPWNLGSNRLSTRDGTYRIVVQGVDAAGNRAAPGEIDFETAVDGPELELARPAPRLSWTRGESGGFEIQVVARDPNGVADVRGVVHRPDGADVPFRLQAIGDYRRETVSVWSGAVAFDESWSNTGLEVRLAAEDGFGTAAESAESREVGSVDLVFPLRLSVDFDGVPVETLHLVEGNHAGAYTFGGRVDAEEERAYSAAGLPPYNTLNPQRSWRVGYEAHEIGSFYLDEHEVSVEQYLAFVSSEEGYPQAANWCRGSAPDAERRASLRLRLAALDPNLPVSDVSWEEASAYARWVGKRLPSLVEWEYAVRGGTLYRPFASARRGARAPGREAINYDPEGLGDGAPWPRTRGGDVTADSGLHDLCGNVAEWTSTPASFLEDARTPLRMPSHVLENRARFLDPRVFDQADAMGRYWVAGGSFQSARADFLTVDRRGRSWRGEAVGFRCACDVRCATVAADSGEAGRPRFRGVFE